MSSLSYKATNSGSNQYNKNRDNWQRIIQWVISDNIGDKVETDNDYVLNKETDYFSDSLMDKQMLEDEDTCTDKD